MSHKILPDEKNPKTEEIQQSNCDPTKVKQLCLFTKFFIRVNYKNKHKTQNVFENIYISKDARKNHFLCVKKTILLFAKLKRFFSILFLFCSTSFRKYLYIMFLSTTRLCLDTYN